jgi:hypothetical protein
VGGRGGTASLVLSAWASGVFVVLWVGAAIGLAGGGALFASAWAWLGGLETAGAVATWVLLLPVCVGLWATQASLPVVFLAAVVGLLALWTALAWSSLARALAARRRRA